MRTYMRRVCWSRPIKSVIVVIDVDLLLRISSVRSETALSDLFLWMKSAIMDRRELLADIPAMELETKTNGFHVVGA